jgi:hypothetical protein
MVNRVELKTLIRLTNPNNEFLKLMESPSVHLMEFVMGNPVFLGRKVIEIP